MTSVRKLLTSSQDSALIALLLLLGGLAGARDIVNLVVPSGASLFFILLVFAIVFGRRLSHQRRISKIAPLPSHPGRFNPFALHDSRREFVVWPRAVEAKMVATRIARATSSHLIISGPSGAGKTTLVSKLVIPLIEGKYQVAAFQNYDNIMLRVIESTRPEGELFAEQRVLVDDYLAFVGANRCAAAEVFEPDFTDRHPEAARLWSRIDRYMERASSSGLPRCLIFDQVERYLQGFTNDGMDDTGINGHELFLFVCFLRCSTKSEKVRTVFIIRADHLYESIDFLDTIISSRSRLGHVDYLLCPGINSASSPQGVREIRENFMALGLGAAETSRFDDICRLDSRTASNTFMTQMVGFVIENFYRSDQNVRNMLTEKKDRGLSVKHFFNHFLNDFVRLSGTVESLDVIKATLFAIASENLTSGRGVGAERAAALTHMPLTAVEDAIRFAVGAGVLLEELADGEPSYRLVHDLVSDYILENEQFTMHPVLKDGIRGLSESRVPTRRLTRIKRYSNVLTDIWEDPNLGLVSVWFLILFGLAKSKSLYVCRWSEGFSSIIPGSESCEIVMGYYVAVFVLHLVWVSFIYNIDRDYLRYVLRSRRLRLLSASMPIVGAALVVLFSQSPSLFVIPIVAVGLMMGSLLLLGVKDGSFTGADAAVRRKWGIRTIANMIITTGFALLTWLVFWDDAAARAFWDQVGIRLGTILAVDGISAAAVANAWMYVACLIMIYFWIHIRPEQQIHVASAARLAAYDRARSEADE